MPHSANHGRSSDAAVSNAAVAASSSSSSSQSAVSTPPPSPPPPPIIVDLNDFLKVKQVLDEGACSFIGSSLGFVEDETIVNVKLLLMTVACCFALVAQFGDIPFPEGRYLLAACCGAYFAVSGVLQLIATFVEKDILMETKKGAAGNGKAFIRLRTAMGRYEDRWTLILEADPKIYGDAGGKNNVVHKKELYVGDFFYSDGVFAEEAFHAAVQEAVLCFEAKLKERRPHVTVIETTAQGLGVSGEGGEKHNHAIANAASDKKRD